MGNFISGAPTESNATFNNASESETMDNVNSHDNDEAIVEEQFHDIISDDEETRAINKENEMNAFRKQLSIKREQRKEILARHRSEKKGLENALKDEQESKIQLCETNTLLRELLIKNNIEIPENLQPLNEQSYITESISHMRSEIDKLKSNNNKLRCDLASSNNALQSAYTDIAELSAQNTESIKQVSALKEVITVSKTLINLREQQLMELKNKLNEIEQSLADRETNMLSTDLRQEYERQLQNIRTLRGLYEERARLADVSRQALTRDLEEQKLLLITETNRSNELNNKVEELEAKVNSLEETIVDKNNLISSCREETRGLKAEMLVVNKLFSQVLLGYKNKQDLDKLIHRLEENHGLLTQMAGRDNESEVSTELPKLLLELINQIDEKDNNDSEELDVRTSNTTPEEIVENLPKVWRVLMELLSHQSEAENNTSEKVTTCYKSVETKSGPVLVPSVSQTYIRLKDLILEKLTLIKEVSRMKQLNTHLESRLGEQERRLCLVTNELSKTWHVVGRLRRHHHQLHTHEKILKYELQQKRKLLNELKEELEYCREKWEQAREKNTQSEKDWRKLRTEFTNRKLKSEQSSFNNSAESGYSDERLSDSSESNDESEYVETKVKCKKKQKKSFETVIDSSTDFNLAAEREDPASDMLDVADLPLDTQEDNPECDVSDSCESENFFKNEKVCDETEDEIGDINANVSSTSIVENSFNDILRNTDNVNEANSISCKNIVNKSTEVFGNSKNPSNDSLINQGNFDEIPSSSKLDVIMDYNSESIDLNNKTVLIRSHDGNAQDTSELLNLATNETQNDCNGESAGTSTINENETKVIDARTILENVRKQNERLRLKDQRLENLENGCSSVVANISNTLNSGDQMIAKLDSLHTQFNEHGDEAEGIKEDSSNLETKPSTDLEEPGTSKDIDHEARFAARDLRLKRLEEQTKSLVKKVNKTATKGVKIHYKLEELHNIYGSENSRSGTPSEDTEDNSQNDDDV